MRRGATAVASVALVLAIAPATDAPAGVGSPPPRKLFVYGDSFSVGTRPFIGGALPGWRVEQDTVHNRGVKDAVAGLRHRAGRTAPVVHLSLGTIDDPTRPGRFRAAVRRAMRFAAGRCVVWPNIWRPARTQADPDWSALNAVLADEAARRDNLVVVDWAGLLWFHREWLDPFDNTHVKERGYRERARVVAVGVRECYRRVRSAARR